MGAAAQAGSQPACPLGVCDGSGWILGPEDIARACECRERTIARARLRGLASVIPAKYRGVSFDRPPVTEIAPDVVQPVRKYCAEIEEMIDSGRGLWFYGDPGTGKTTLAMLVSKTALEHGRSVAIYSMPKLLARIRRTYDAGAGEQSYAELFERLATVDLLHIDDLGSENRTEWVLEQQVGARVVSRLGDMCETLPLFGEDRRLRLAPPPAPNASSAPDGGALGPLDH